VFNSSLTATFQSLVDAAPLHDFALAADVVTWVETVTTATARVLVPLGPVPQASVTADVLKGVPFALSW